MSNEQTGKTAMEMSLRQNYRQQRAEYLAAAVLNQLDRQGRHLEASQCHAVYDAVVETFMAEGVEVVTDETRRQAGLPPRGPDGLTAEELIELERIRLEMLRDQYTVPRIMIDACHYGAGIGELRSDQRTRHVDLEAFYRAPETEEDE